MISTIITALLLVLWVIFLGILLLIIGMTLFDNDTKNKEADVGKVLAVASVFIGLSITLF